MNISGKRTSIYTPFPGEILEGDGVGVDGDGAAGFQVPQGQKLDLRLSAKTDRGNIHAREKGVLEGNNAAHTIGEIGYCAAAAVRAGIDCIAVVGSRENHGKGIVPGEGHAPEQVNISGDMVDGHLGADGDNSVPGSGHPNTGKYAYKHNDKNEFGQGEA